MKRFVILGLPRSGSTYLMTLLNAHPDVFCSGEQFNPYAVVGVEESDSGHYTLLGRDKDPVGHMNAFFDAAEARGMAWAGFKYMVGHNIAILHELARRPEITILYIWRENRLAQVSSLMKANMTKNWAQTRHDKMVDTRIHATPRNISHRWHEFATYDQFVTMWLNTLSNPQMTYEYRDLFKPGFEEGLCDLLDVPYTPRMKSPLVKQGTNTIEDRFVDPKPIRYYFHQLELGRWLEDEI